MDPVEVNGTERVDARILGDGRLELTADGRPFLIIAAGAPDPADWLAGLSEAAREAGGRGTP